MNEIRAKNIFKTINQQNCDGHILSGFDIAMQGK